MSIVETLVASPVRIPDIVFDMILHNYLRDVIVDCRTLGQTLSGLMPDDPEGQRHILGHLLRHNLSYIYGSRDSYLLRVRKYGRLSIHEYRMNKRIVEARIAGTARRHPPRFEDTEFEVDSSGEYVFE
jgi:hypothetical protein